ncbi:MAG: hypothetical protein AAF235_10020 [Planctomycetota bacterium]
MQRVAFIVVLSFIAGCARLHAPPEGDAGLFEAGAPNPFAPIGIEISPLTRVERWSSGEPVLAVYLRLVDEWGHGTKAPARFNVQLFRVRGTSGLAERDDGWTWQIDLRDPDQNSGWFDATGLYRLPLSGVPGWVLEPERSDEVMRITVIASVMGPEGDVVAPRDTINKVVTRWDGQ